VKEKLAEHCTAIAPDRLIGVVRDKTEKFRLEPRWFMLKKQTFLGKGYYMLWRSQKFWLSNTK
jgi:hypothetical protein